MTSNAIKNLTVSTIVLFSFLLIIASTINPTYAIYSLGSLSVLFLLFLFIVGRLNALHYVMILIPFLVLSPEIALPNLPAARLDDFWLLCGLIIITFKTIIAKNIEFNIPNYTKWFLLFVAWIVFTIFLSSYREPNLYTIRDWLEPYKALKLIVLLVLMTTIKMDNQDKQKIIKNFLFTMLIASIFGFVQYFNLWDINSWLSHYYVDNELQAFNLETQNRVVSTFGNSNVFGGALLIAIAFSLANFLSDLRFRHFMYTSVFFIALITTMSRTVFLLSLILVFLMTIGFIKKKKLGLKSFLALSSLPFVGILGLTLAPDRFFYRMQFLGDILNDTSFQARLIMWNYIFEDRTKINLLTGTGPVKNLHFYYDNEWLMLLTIYGAVGVVLFVIIFGSIYFAAKRIEDFNFYSIAVQSLIIVIAGYMITLPFYHDLQLAPMFILVLGVVLNKTAINNYRTNDNRK